ncbi:MAG: hypothetical protein KDE63_02570 [Novosphingobium sp.]|nr:hypothetical protein [Novosphingobium sp.]
MKPAIPDATQFLATVLRDDIMPQLTGFRAGNVGMAAAMLDMVAEQWDGAAARLHAENKVLRALVARCAIHFGQTPPLTPDEEDLRISSLTRENEVLKTHLIDLHAAIEADDSAVAGALNSEIWDFLRSSVESQRISSANF